MGGGPPCLIPIGGGAPPRPMFIAMPGGIIPIGGAIRGGALGCVGTPITPPRPVGAIICRDGPEGTHIFSTA